MRRIRYLELDQGSVVLKAGWAGRTFGLIYSWLSSFWSLTFPQQYGSQVRPIQILSLYKSSGN